MSRVKFDDQGVIQLYHPEDPPNVVQNADVAVASIIAPIQDESRHRVSVIASFRQWIVKLYTQVNEVVRHGILCCFQLFNIRDSIRYLVIGVSVILLGLVVFAGIYVMFNSGSAGGDSTIERGFNGTASLPIIDTYRVD